MYFIHFRETLYMYSVLFLFTMTKVSGKVMVEVWITNVLDFILDVYVLSHFYESYTSFY